MNKTVPVIGTSSLVNHINDVNMNRAKAGTVFGNQHTILPKVFENSKQVQTQGKTMSVDLISVQSNFARNKTIVLNNGELVLQFDKKGIAEFPRHKLPILENEMKFRPGRYTILANQTVTDVVEPVKESVEVEVDIEDEEPIVVKKTTKKNKENK